MTKTKEELDQLMTEFESLNSKLKEIDEEELGNIAGGMISFEPLYELLHKNNITKEQLLKNGTLSPAHIISLTTNHNNFFEDFCKKHNIDLEKFLEYIKNKEEEQ